MTKDEKEIVATIKLSLLRAIVDLNEETLAMAIRVPKSEEPSEDCVSRRAVLEILKNNRYRFNISQEGYCEGKVLWSENLIKDDACKEIEQLPSVTPTRNFDCRGESEDKE